MNESRTKVTERVSEEDEASRGDAWGEVVVGRVEEPLERLLRVGEVARILSLSCKAEYALGARGVLPRVKVGRQVRWRPRDVRRFLEAAGEAGEE
jgi:excisionase family DNA binding protein